MSVKGREALYHTVLGAFAQLGAQKRRARMKPRFTGQMGEDARP